MEDEIIQQESGGGCGLSAVDDARRVAAGSWNSLLCDEFQSGVQKKCYGLFCKGIFGGQNAESLYRLQPLCKMGVSASPQSFHDADYIATGHYGKDQNSFQTADMPLKSQ